MPLEYIYVLLLDLPRSCADLRSHPQNPHTEFVPYVVSRDDLLDATRVQQYRWESSI